MNFPTQLETIRCRLAEHRRLPFPEATGDDRLDDLLLELCELDGHWVGCSSRVLEFAGRGGPGVDERDLALLDTLERACAMSRGQSSSLREVGAYVSSLRQLAQALQGLERRG